MKNILAQLNDISSALEDAGLISEADTCHDVFIRVAKKKKSKPKKNVPTNPELYAKCKSEVKSKFEVWPSAYGSMALTKLYKSRGGTYKTE
jgi:hypothetical protein